MWLNTLILICVTVILICVLFSTTVSIMVFNVSLIYWLADISFLILSAICLSWWIDRYKKCRVEQK